MRPLVLVLSFLAASSCSPQPPMTPAEKQDYVDYIKSICDFFPSDEAEQRICAEPLPFREKAKKLRLHRDAQGKP